MSEKEMSEQNTSGNPAAEDQPNESQTGENSGKEEKNPVKKWTFIILAAVVLLLVWYLISDRVTPTTSQARVHALIVPIAPEVSGTVISVEVGNNQRVEAGQELFHLDPERYQLAVNKAEADLQTARQSLGASSANVSAAEAGLESAKANLVRSEKDAIRLKRIREEDPGAISQRRIESAEASLAVAQGQVDAARANVEKAKQALGEMSEANPLIQQAQSALKQATLNLESTVVRAPENGVVTDVRVTNGNFANASAPQMAFISVDNVWIQADFTENNLGHIEAGDEVKIVFDILPGSVFPGTVREIGFGIAVDSAPLGSLPTIDNNRSWLRASQRYPVVVDFDFGVDPDTLRLRVGSQATVVVYTGTHPLFNMLASLQIWLTSIVTYAY